MSKQVASQTYMGQKSWDSGSLSPVPFCRHGLHSVTAVSWQPTCLPRWLISGSPSSQPASYPPHYLAKPRRVAKVFDVPVSPPFLSAWPVQKQAGVRGTKAYGVHLVRLPGGMNGQRKWLVSFHLACMGPPAFYLQALTFSLTHPSKPSSSLTAWLSGWEST